MATNIAVTGSSEVSPVTVSFSSRAATDPSPTTRSTVLLVAKRILSLFLARSSMIAEARNSSRRWTMVTDLANLVRNVASSMAESPPPMTAMSWSRKKKPSQVAQELTPWPSSSCSPGAPR